MKRNVTLCFLSLAIAVLSTLLGCAPAALLRSVDPSARQLPGTVLAFDYLFDTSDSFIKDSGCNLTIRNIESHQKYLIEMPSSRKSVAVVIPTGSYELREYYCYQKAAWEFNDRPSIYVVEPGKINYGGAVNITRDPETRDLRWQYYTGIDQTKSFWKSLSREDRARVVTAIK